MDNTPIETKNYRPPKKSKNTLLACLACFVAGAMFGVFATSVAGGIGSSAPDAETTTGGIYMTGDMSGIYPSYSTEFGETHAHLFDKTQIIQEASCTEPGTAMLYCRYCQVEQMQYLPATGHSETIIPGYPATQYRDGLTDGILCKNCGEILKEQEIIPSGTPSGETEFEWSAIDGLSCEITGYLGEETDITIPQSIDGYRVTAIAESAFSGMANIQTVTISHTLDIADNAFYGCTGMRVLYILGDDSGDNIHIGSMAFYNCTSLEQIYFADVQSIGSEAFMNCTSLSAVYFNDADIESINGGAFAYCGALDQIYYSGTIYEWQNVNKADGWDDYTPDHIIYCSDGSM